MKGLRLTSLLLACVLLLSAFSLCAYAETVTIDFIPTIKNGTIYGISLKTPQNVFRSFYTGKSVEIFDKDGTRLDPSSTTYMGTGFTVKVDGRALYTVVVMGDFDGDGELTARDYLLTKRTCMGTYYANSLARQAAGADAKSDIRPINYIKVKRAYFGTYEINKDYSCDPYDPTNGENGWSDNWV